MKLTKEMLLEMIEEEVKNSESNVKTEPDRTLGKAYLSKADRTKELRSKIKDPQAGVDAKERGIVSALENSLMDLANLGDIKSGSTFSILKKLDLMMKKEIARLSKGKTDEE